MKTTEKIIGLISHDMTNEISWLMEMEPFYTEFSEFGKLSPEKKEIESGEILKNIINTFKKTEKNVYETQKKMYKYIVFFYGFLCEKNRNEFQVYLERVENKKYGI